MKKIKNLLIVISLLLVTTLLYFQKWLGPVKNWGQIKDFSQYASASSEMYIADAYHFINTFVLAINTSNIEYNSFILTSYSFINQMLVNVLSLVTKNPILAINLFDYIGYILLTIVSFNIFRRLNINKIFSFSFSIIFCFSFYNQVQGLNILSSWYFSVPIYIYFAIKLFDILEEKNTLLNKNFVLSLLMFGFFLPLFGLAYSLIGNIIILTAGFLIYFALNNENNERYKNGFRALILAYFFISSASYILILNFNKYLLHYYKTPLLVDVEQNSFKIVQLLLPNIFHRDRELSALTDYYSSFFAATETNYFSLMPINGENTSVALGFIASIGFFFILVLGIRSLANHIFNNAKSTSQPSSLTLQLIRKTFPLLLIVVIMGSLGGLGGLVSVVFPSLGIEWFRASPFIHFFALIVIASALQESLDFKVIRNFKRSVTLIMAGSFLAFALYDQVPSHCGNCRSDAETTAKQAKDFFQNKIFAKDSSADWLQLPITPTNMVSPSSYQYLYVQNKLQQYLSAKPSQISQRFESPKVFDRWKTRMSSLSIDDQVILARYLGMRGVVINKANWCDWVTELPKLEQNFQLTKLLETPAIPKSNIDAILAYSFAQPLSTDQQQRVKNILLQNGFQELNGLLKDQFDFAQPIDFATGVYPNHVKNLDGLIGDKNIKISQAINEAKCVTTYPNKKEDLSDQLVSWGDNFSNPFNKNKVHIEFYSPLPKVFNLHLYLDKQIASQHNPTKVPLEVMVGAERKVIDLSYGPRELVLNFDISYQPTIDQINLSASVPMMSLYAQQQSSGQNGLIVIKSIQIETVKP